MLYKYYTMISEKTELQFSSRAEFRRWLTKNAETSGGVWLVFGKTGDVVTLTANEALEEALCFGWIDGQMQSIDKSKYIKYFAGRRDKSPWSDKNKKTAEMLIKAKLMTGQGIKAIENAKKNGAWDAPKRQPITDDQVSVLKKKLKGHSPAYENFCGMSKSVRVSYTGRFFSFKTEEARERDFAKIVERLNNNLKPMQAGSKQ